jgi:hypothetical protein
MVSPSPCSPMTSTASGDPWPRHGGSGTGPYGPGRVTRGKAVGSRSNHAS